MTEDRKIVEFKVSSKIWYSQGDEDSFFRWLASIHGYISCMGEGWELQICFNKDMTQDSLVEVAAIFLRYCPFAMKQLEVFGGSEVGEWFSSPDRFWHTNVFGAASTASSTLG